MQFKTLDQVWKAIDNGQTVCWVNEGYVIEVVSSNLQWLNRMGYEPPYSNRNGKSLRVTYTANYFGTFLEESDLPKLFT